MCRSTIHSTTSPASRQRMQKSSPMRTTLVYGTMLVCVGELDNMPPWLWWRAIYIHDKAGVFFKRKNNHISAIQVYQRVVDIWWIAHLRVLFNSRYLQPIGQHCHSLEHAYNTRANISSWPHTLTDNARCLTGTFDGQVAHILLRHLLAHAQQEIRHHWAMQGIGLWDDVIMPRCYFVTS